MKLHKAIEDVHEAEAALAGQLRRMSERHPLEADLYHLGHTLAGECAEHLRLLAPFAKQYGADPAPDDVGADSPTVLQTLRRKGGELIGRAQMSGLLLLADLRKLYLAAQDAEITWVILAQGARALRDRELIDVACRCQEAASERGKWLRSRIKETSPQVLAAG